MAADAQPATQLFRNPRINGWILVAWTLGALCVQIGIAFVLYGVGEEGLRVCARGTLRIGLVLFLGAILASSLPYFTHSDFAKWILRNRRQLGFSFGCAHFFHIGFIMLLLQAGHLETNGGLLREPGVIVYGFIGLMMLTSFDATTRPLPRWLWLGIHKVGIYSIWFAFVGAFAGRVAEGQLFYLPIALALFAAMGVRCWVGLAHFRRRRVAVA